jgi:hypothetical protein
LQTNLEAVAICVLLVPTVTPHGVWLADRVARCDDNGPWHGATQRRDDRTEYHDVRDPPQGALVVPMGTDGAGQPVTRVGRGMGVQMRWPSMSGITV